MLAFTSAILNLILSIARSKKSLICENALLRKELEILKRRDTRKKVTTNGLDRLFVVVLARAPAIRQGISIVRPETVLRWQRNLTRRFWTFRRSQNRRGRKPVPKHIRYLILEMKNDNIVWGVKRIQGELAKLAIFLDPKTIWNILRDFRRGGKVRKGLSWKKFLEMQANSVYAMNFFTVDTILNRRFYVYFIISHKTREIIRFAITENPVREFVRQQIIEFENSVNGIVCMIHDRAPQFLLHYGSYGIRGIRTSIQAPNMNAIAERFVGSIRREALDHFILLGRSQVTRILSDYVTWYNAQRPHEGLEQAVPKGYRPESRGKILKMPILSGLHHHYYRRAA